MRTCLPIKVNSRRQRGTTLPLGPSEPLEGEAYNAGIELFLRELGPGSSEILGSVAVIFLAPRNFGLDAVFVTKLPERTRPIKPDSSLVRIPLQSGACPRRLKPDVETLSGVHVTRREGVLDLLNCSVEILKVYVTVESH